MSDLASFYLANTGLHAVLVLSPKSGERFRIVACAGASIRKPISPVVVASQWWVQDEAIAKRLTETCYDLAAANGIERQNSWLKCDAAQSAGLVLAGAARLGIVIHPDKPLRERAKVIIREVQGDMETRRLSGDLKAINREYKAERLAVEKRGGSIPSYSHYIEALAKRTLAEHAQRVGVGAA